ncbi:pentatricopeptide repeat-containing protein At1g10270-like [Galendromus occidentalis]|uniref:Pentatricopeptide repeat-containing protein At1g10270-like n=1 Tax=Galendromus occidentalis TaxID=34638 RepID=A0AAJ7SE69_9ACAR|nr:pentatricopeptide repeat-containing protein At1g10270-like [Galendromus occidentalis]
MVFFLRSIFFVCALAAASLGAPGYQRPDPHSVSEDFQESPKKYRFAFSSEDAESNQRREETADDNGHVKGSYSFDLPDGTKRHVKYIADEGGFRVKIDSNEAGLEPKNPADVKFIAQTNAQLKEERTDRHSATHSSQSWSDTTSAPLKSWSDRSAAHSTKTSARYGEAASPAPLKASGWSAATPAPQKTSGWSDGHPAQLTSTGWSNSRQKLSWSPETASALNVQANKWADELPVKNTAWSDDRSAPLKNAGWSDSDAARKESKTASQRRTWSDSDSSPASNDWSRPSAALKQAWPQAAAQKSVWSNDKAAQKQGWAPKSAPLRESFPDVPVKRGWAPHKSATVRQGWGDEESGAQKVQEWQSDNVSPKESWSQKPAAIQQSWAPQKSAVIGQGCADESADLKQSAWSESAAAQEQKPWAEKKSAVAEKAPSDSSAKNQGWNNEAQDYDSVENVPRRGNRKFERLTAELNEQKSNVQLELPHADRVEWFAPPAVRSAALTRKW